MLLIAGLGNPGEKYKKTRHNVGFMFVDYMATLSNGSIVSNGAMEQSASSFKFNKYVNAEIAKINLQTPNSKFQALLVKPQTYMNRSGESIKKLITNYQLPITNIVVAHDDLDIEIGKFKIQQGVGPKKHNGISSVEQHLHTPDFMRIRIGVDNRKGDRTLSGEDYVLQKFSFEEYSVLETTFIELNNQLLTQLSQLSS